MLNSSFFSLPPSLLALSLSREGGGGGEVGEQFENFVLYYQKLL
jgi:hypothetical protein